MSLVDNGDGTITREGLPEAALDALREPPSPAQVKANDREQVQRDKVQGVVDERQAKRIGVRSKGIPMRAGTPTDADGAHVFSLDADKHDDFEVIKRMLHAAGAPESNPEGDERHAAIMEARRFGCPQTMCSRLNGACARQGKCALR